jgi:hypothetical protein
MKHRHGLFSDTCTCCTTEEGKADINIVVERAHWNYVTYRRKYYFATSLDKPNKTMEKIRIPTIASRSEDFPRSMHECQPFHHTFQVYRSSENIFQFSNVADRIRQAVNLRLPKYTPIMLYVFFWVIPRGLNFVCRRYSVCSINHSTPTCL